MDRLKLSYSCWQVMRVYYLHSNMDRLKHGGLQLNRCNPENLHSNMDRLKLESSNMAARRIVYLHSNMDRLKPSSINDNFITGLFTFQYG